ncbi:heavy-metal-associated domain-containing protein [Pseudoclavibacter sp. CFCC 11306]|uniref:heavy-metal-associated domain-containing protein n=1 Tax=Pseudoclavibacter sp. CFCC 11306 TaxID=1564493 RepID=UPI00130165F6|nr:heavy metal-associated domain-containing protein [Pseudoclavibacter sp. CFCC 11306]KAB1658111.1 heavy-metal-associated domain-containing protein [Pseudoclavibacter sp. CFCC 11306]
MSTITDFAVTGMSCGHCEHAVREEVEKIPGVQSLEVSAQTGRLHITSEQPLDDAAVLAAVEEAGYSATHG